MIKGTAPASSAGTAIDIVDGVLQQTNHYQVTKWIMLHMEKQQILLLDIKLATQFNGKRRKKHVVFFGLTITTVVVSQTSGLSLDTKKAKDSAASTFEILDSKPAIHSSSDEGTSLDIVKG